jgi:hypothetical protein
LPQPQQEGAACADGMAGVQHVAPDAFSDNAVSAGLSP